MGPIEKSLPDTIRPQQPQKPVPAEPPPGPRTISSTLTGNVSPIALLVAKIFGGRVGWNQSTSLYELENVLKDVSQKKPVQANALEPNYQKIASLPLAEQIRFLRLAYTLLRKKAPEVFVDIYTRMSADARIGTFSVSERDRIATSMLHTKYPLSHFEQFTPTTGITWPPSRENFECFSLHRKVAYFEFYVSLPEKNNKLVDDQLTALSTNLSTKEREHFRKLVAKRLEQLATNPSEENPPSAEELKDERVKAFQAMLRTLEQSSETPATAPPPSTN